MNKIINGYVKEYYSKISDSGNLYAAGILSLIPEPQLKFHLSNET